MRSFYTLLYFYQKRLKPVYFFVREKKNYLKKLCEEEGYNINSSEIRKAIDEVFEYKRTRS